MKHCENCDYLADIKCDICETNLCEQCHEYIHSIVSKHIVEIS